MGDHAAAILCGVSGLPFPGRRAVILCGNAEAEEGSRHGTSAGIRAAQLGAAMNGDGTPSITRINPPDLGTPPGYSQVVDVSAGRIIFISGQTGADRDGDVVGKNDF